MLMPNLKTHADTLDALFDLSKFDHEALIKYNTYRKALINEGYTIRANYSNLHTIERKKTNGK